MSQDPIPPDAVIELAREAAELPGWRLLPEARTPQFDSAGNLAASLV
jgi:hypothetical protein